MVFDKERSHYIRCEKGFLELQTSRPICSLIYVTDHVKCLLIWCRQWRRHKKKESASGDILSKGDVIVKKFSKEIA